MGHGRESVYVYGVGSAQLVLPDGLTGLEGAPVRLCQAGDLGAVISNTELETVRAERRHLFAHQTVLSRVMAGADMLPVAFGSISESEGALRSLLAEHVMELSRQLVRVAGRVEMTVRLRWREEDTFRVFVERFPQLRKRRDACFGGRREPGQMELLDLGRAFETLLKRERESKTNLALGILGQVAVETKNVEPTNERLLFDLNCLIRRDQETYFGSAVDELASKLDDDLVLELRGPVPPYSFVNITI